MLFAETEMRFGEPAISLALAPMDIGKGQMRFSATGIAFGKAPKAVGVTAMRREDGHPLAPAAERLYRKR